MIPRGIPIESQELFRLAMRHRSATGDPVRDSYERMEFYGDAVLGLVIAQYLYEHHPDWDQGMMSKARSTIVQEGPLAEAALALGLDQHVELAASEEIAEGRQRPSVLCDLFESVVGAIYIESGLEKARWFVLERLHPYLERVNRGEVAVHDYKSRLQELAQALWRQTPTYRVVRANGATHTARFRIEVLFDGEAIGEGEGRSKKDAEQAAAQDALEVIQRAQRLRESQSLRIRD